MSPSRRPILSSPWFRAPFLVFAVVATVATTEASWSLGANPVSEDLTLAPGQVVERRITFSASHPTHVSAEFSQRVDGGTEQATRGTRVSLVLDDEANGPTPSPPRAFIRANACEATFLFDAVGAGQWANIDVDDRPTSATRPNPGIGASCAKNGTIGVRLKNESNAPLTLHFSVSAGISELGDDTPPDDAFVRANLIP